MFVGTNRIKIKKGYGNELEELFRSRGEVAREPGFVDFELWRQEGDSEHEEYLVVSRWESEEHHNQWLRSDSFKQAHSGPPTDYIMGHGEFSSYQIRLAYQAEK
mgnify:FL=1